MSRDAELGGDKPAHPAPANAGCPGPTGHAARSCGLMEPWKGLRRCSRGAGVEVTSGEGENGPYSRAWSLSQPCSEDPRLGVWGPPELPAIDRGACLPIHITSGSSGQEASRSRGK